MVDGVNFRKVLSSYPTGVCVITAIGNGGARVAMVVGSFTSVSLDPPLVAFFPDKKSSSWPLIERAGRFCVNVLAADQLGHCRKFAASGGDKFEGISFTVSDNGSPVLNGVIAWIDCMIEQVAEAGDHLFVLGRVHSLGVHRHENALLFQRGKYGQFEELDHAT